MPHSALKLLRDIQESGRSIQRLVAGMEEPDYSDNRTIRLAIEREFEIIGEALRRMSQDAPAVFAQIGFARQAIDFRNMLAHNYEAVDDAIVWRIIHKRLPLLLAAVDRLAAAEQG